MEATLTLRDNAANPYAEVYGEEASVRQPAVAFLSIAALDDRRIAQWNAATLAAISRGDEIVDGVLVAGDAAILFDYAKYHPKIQGWEVSLIRPATGIRGIYYTEVAHVARVFDLLDVPLGGLHLWYLNKSARWTAGEAKNRLFLESNLLKRSRKNRRTADEQIAALRSIVTSNGDVPIDYRCSNKVCAICDRREYESYDQFHPRTLHKGGDIAREIVESGITDIRDPALPLRKLSNKQRIQVAAVREDRLHLDKPRIDSFIERLVYPRFYLDFEAFAPALPPFTGLRPYEHTPVIASIHVVADPGADPVAYAFVAKPGRDDRKAMYRWLKETLGETGSVIVFSTTFESAMIRQLAGCAGDSGEAIVSRIVDLLEPFAGLWIYHPEQRGKVSLKRVLPVFTDTPGYHGESVRDGMHANLGYIRLCDRSSKHPSHLAAEGASDVLTRYAPENTTYVPRAEEILQYCAVDTIAMHHVVQRLEELAAVQEKS